MSTVPKSMAKEAAAGESNNQSQGKGKKSAKILTGPLGSGEKGNKATKGAFLKS